MTTRIYFNEDWFFTQVFTEEMLLAFFDNELLQKVRLPHTVTEVPYNYFDETCYQMKSGYRKIFYVDQTFKGKCALLTFEGAAHQATVYLNGTEIITHSCGYTAFTVDIAPYLNYDSPNVLVVALDSRENMNIPPFGRAIDYMTYGGLYREVYLDVKDAFYIKDAFVTTSDVTKEEKVLTAQISLNKWQEGLSIRQSLIDLGEGATTQLLKTSPLHHEMQTFKHSLSNVSLWNLQHPHLYMLRLELMNGDRILDTKEVRFGFREAEFKANGFYLNGEKIKLRGLNRHQSYPYVGYAMPKSPQVRDADLLKNELGLNAVRTSHYPQSQYFIDRCDEIGLLVFTEIPGWQYIGDAAWKEVSYTNVEEMILQYRNHPSIILWGVRINESPDDDPFYSKTNKIAHALDSSRATGGVRCIKKSHLLEDVYTYNDFFHDGTNHGTDQRKKVCPDSTKPYLISEYNGHMFPTKAFDCEAHRLEHALRHIRVLDAASSEDCVTGSFGWCMFDYNTHKDFGSGDRICYHGIMDMFRNPKLAAAAYSSQQDHQTVLEVSSSMDVGEHPGSFMGDVYVFTNADSIGLYKNDEFIKEYRASTSPFKSLEHGPILIDDLIGDQLERKEGYNHQTAEGIKNLLMAASRYGLNHLPLSTKLLAAKMVLFHGVKVEDGINLYNKYIGNWGGMAPSYKFEAIKNGQVVQTVIKSPFKQIKLHVDVDHTLLHEEHTYDVACIRIRATDEHDNLLHFYQEPVHLEVSGPLEIIGPHTISLKGGMGGTYVKTMQEKGEAHLTLSGNQFKSVTLTFSIE